MGSYSYFVTITLSGSGCNAAISQNAVIDVVADPVVSVQPISASYCQNGTPVTALTVGATGGIGTFSYQWYSNTTNSNTNGTIISGATTTTYTLSVTASNGCTSTDNAVVTVLPYCIKPLDAFTPNKDGTNDLWLVTAFGGTCVGRVYVNVFNRYGNVVYKSDNYTNNWDGTYNGAQLPSSDYWFTLDYTDPTTGNPQVLRAHFALKR